LGLFRFSRRHARCLYDAQCCGVWPINRGLLPWAVPVISHLPATQRRDATLQTRMMWLLPDSMRMRGNTESYCRLRESGATAGSLSRPGGDVHYSARMVRQRRLRRTRRMEMSRLVSLSEPSALMPDPEPWRFSNNPADSAGPPRPLPWFSNSSCPIRYNFDPVRCRNPGPWSS
jgi:hypothetical protein